MEQGTKTYIPTNLNQIIHSIIINGEKSIFLNQFIDICSKISLGVIRVSRSRNFITDITGCSNEDLAIDSIADLFKNDKGKFPVLIVYFKDVDFENIERDILLAKLFALITSRTTQRMIQIKREAGDPYLKLKKAYEAYLDRDENISRIFFNKLEYLYICKKNEIEMDKPEINPDTILQYLFGVPNAFTLIPRVIKEIFNFLNSQKENCKAIKRTTLHIVIYQYFKGRFSSHLDDL